MSACGRRSSQRQREAGEHRARKAGIEQCGIGRSVRAHAVRGDVVLVEQIAYLDEQTPGCAFPAAAQTEQTVAVDPERVAGIRPAVADDIERRAEVEAAGVPIEQLAVQRVL